ncbi:LysR family transcriptional regulator [Rhodovastum atsumiense]|uniref:LysR family transcriptional regulator n=2 Tax=Rhodovastum atsumiense TaxID=504468 RepID=A0A5M6IL76_9PROT|nr:LysR family transcriptional regulator [Rhodovastum atsumiense]
MTGSFDPILLETFLAVTQTRNFTHAAQRLGLRQSTVSQHIRRLEQQAGRRLFQRDTHSVVLTPDGEAMIGFARSILEANARARHYFGGARLRGHLRFGVSDDFVQTRLPELLRDFVLLHPGVDLALTVGTSALLRGRLDEGELDLVLCKRQLGEDRGELVWRERLAWVGRADLRLSSDPAQPVPLILYAPPSITRSTALETLERAGRPWRIVCTSSSLSGLRAAAFAGLGIAVSALSLIPPELVDLGHALRLPDLGETEFVLLGGQKPLRGPPAALAQALLASGDRLQRPATGGTAPPR